MKIIFLFFTDGYLLPCVFKAWPQQFGMELLIVLIKKTKKQSLQLVVWNQLKLIVPYAPVSNVSANFLHSLMYLRGTLILRMCISINQIQLQKGHTENGFPTLVDLFSYCTLVAAIFKDIESLSLIELSLKWFLCFST